MFKRILIPTDGSELSRKAIRAGVALAAEVGAQISGFHVLGKFRTFTLDPEMLEETAAQYRKASERRAEHILGEVRRLAKKAGVECDVGFAVSDQPYVAIIREAKKKRCDLILMASHGHRGLKGLLLGSETQKVLTHSALPVLVYR